MNTTDRIEKQVTLRAPVSRVWNAIANAKAFGKWFGIELHGEFAVGKQITGTFKLDAAAIVDYQKRLGMAVSGVKLPGPQAVFCTVERIEPERQFSFRWIPYGIDAETDPHGEPTTLVEFQLEPSGGDTVLTIVESGFDRVPARRRDRAFRMNDAGWAGQAENIKNYVDAL